MSGFRVQSSGLGFRVQGLGFWAQDLAIKTWEIGAMLRAWATVVHPVLAFNLVAGVQILGRTVSDFGLKGSGPGS